MIRSLCLVVSISGAVCQAPVDPVKPPVNYEMKWKNFKSTYGKKYSTALEEEQRYQIFKTNVDLVYATNNMNYSFQLGINEFADLTVDEFSSTHYGISKPDKLWGSLPNLGTHTYNGESLDSSVDWTTKGAVTPVKNQGQCGSCWAYSTTETIESALWMSTKELKVLSEQQIISCDYGDDGCNGGDIPSALDYVQSYGGIEYDRVYPETSFSTGRNGRCEADKNNIAVVVKSYKFAIPECQDNSCDHQNEHDLMAQLQKNGPLAICVNANDWDDYTGGIWTKACPGGYYDLDHCVQLVGYDNEYHTPYWKVRNSWTTDWGENGFIRLAMGQNLCGVASEVVAVVAGYSSPSVVV